MTRRSAPAQFRRAPDQLDEGAHERQVILHRDHAPDRSDDDFRSGEKAGRPDRTKALGARVESLRVDAVVDLLDAVRLDADRFGEPCREIPADGDVPPYERPEDAPEEVVPAVGAVQIERVPAVLAVHPRPHAGKRRDELALERGEVAGMDEVGPELPQGAPEAQVERGVLAGPLVQRVERHVARADSLTVIGESVEADHRMPVPVPGDVVQQVHHAVLQAADVEAVDDMSNEGNPGHRRRAFRSPPPHGSNLRSRGACP